MSDLDTQFQTALEAVESLPSKPDNDILLELYALYKQANDGDVSGKRPSMFDFVGGAKFDAWEKLKGTDQSTAKQQYIDLVSRLQQG